MENTVALAQSALAPTFGAVRLTDPVDLGGSARSQVLRCRVERAGSSAPLGAGPDLPPTVIVKRFLSDAGAFVRETVGLDVCPGTPTLLAQDQEHGLIVMSDLGVLPTLADLLLGDDRDAAWDGARSWARALGRTTGGSRARVAEARSRLAAAEPWDADADLRAGVDRLLEAVAGGDMGPDADAGPEGHAAAARRTAVEAELAAALHLRAPGAAAVVSPTDTCPDNAVLGPDGWHFLDLEGTDVQHAAFVAAYGLLPFATCWCVFDPPAGLTDMLLAELTAGLAEHAPDVVADPAWDTSVRQACALYLVLVTGWLWKSTVAGRELVGPAGRSPSYRQLMVSRWRWGALNLRADLPALAAVFGDAAAWALDQWGADVEPTGYRAFR
ncbi:hypothetical protein [Promicromonospora sukumoe]|uniref:hypothetical protein n=1 Tax=Promicromonospora sukumoe TaxID=88382 RepID=UPI0003738DEF|nr:hypothetical protein [Promicromonospora sukumoe]